MPSPANYNNRDDFLEDCIPMMMDEGRDQDQAVAACISMWEERSVSNIAQKAAGVHRAHSLITIKAINNEQRTIEGIATTPSVDHVGDIVDPMGAKFMLPMPLLWMHNHEEPVGHVTFARATKDGITIKATIAKLDEPGELKNLVDKAWQAVKAQLVRGLSIGFSAKDWEPIKDGGIKYLTWIWHETSLVTIPAQSQATISLVKSIDAGLLAATGRSGGSRSSDGKPGDSGKRTTTSVTLNRGNTAMKKTIAEQLESLESTRASKSARMAAVMEKSIEEGRSTDEAEREEFDTLERELDALDGDIKRLRVLEKANLAQARPVGQPQTQAQGTQVRSGGTVRVTAPQEEPGLRFARVVKSLGIARGNLGDSIHVAEGMYGSDQGVVNVLRAAARHGGLSDISVKAAVAAGTTDNATWAGNLVGDETGVLGAFLEFLRPQTVLGKFGTNGVPALRRVPFRTAIISQTSGGAAYWTGEAAGKGLTKFDFARTRLEALKVACISVITEELLRDSSPSADVLVRDSLAAAIAERLDVDFLDPNKVAAAGISPASVTNGAPTIASGGNTADDIREDVRRLFAAFAAANNPLSAGVFIMPSTTAIALSMVTNALGQSEFPNVGVSGGTIFGLPVVTSEHVPSVGSPVSAYVVLMDASAIMLGDDGGVSIDLSREASLQMDSAPTMSSGGIGSPDAPTGASVVSMFQTNSVAFRAERTINWVKARTHAVQVLSGVAWGTP